MINLKYQFNANLCYMNTDSVTIHIKTEDLHKDIANDAEKDLIHQNIQLKDYYQKVKIKNSLDQWKMNWVERLWQNLLHLDQKHILT